MTSKVHVVFECPRLRVAGAQNFGYYEIQESELDRSQWKVKQLVGMLNNSSIRELLKYDPKEDNTSTVDNTR